MDGVVRPMAPTSPSRYAATDGLSAAVDTQLSKQILDVRRHRPRAEHEVRCDLRLRVSFGEERQNLALARAEGRHVSVRSAGCATGLDRFGRPTQRAAHSGHKLGRISGFTM
jgi:hypothetical protein